MARQRMVTRTVDVTRAEVMTLDVTKAEVFTTVYEVNGIFKDDDSVLKAVKKIYETETYKCVAVTGVETTERLYGMLESEFIKIAKVLPPRTKNETDESIEE